MAKSSTSFKPANQFGKRSKRTISELQRQITKNTKDDIFRAWDYVADKDVNELKKIREEKIEKGLVLEMASARIYAIKYGDFSKIDRIFDRILGKSEQKTFSNVNLETTVGHIDTRAIEEYLEKLDVNKPKKS